MIFDYKKDIQKQVDFIKDDYSRVLFLAGRGAGKSHSSAIKTIRWLFKSNVTGMIAAPTFKQLAISHDKLFELINTIKMSDDEVKLARKLQRNKSLHPFIKSYNKQEREFTTINNSKIYLRSTDDVNSVRGYSLDFAHIDEASIVKEEAVRNIELCLRNGTNPQLFLSTTPAGLNWLYKDKDNYHIYTMKTTDNLYLPKEFIDSLPKDNTWSRQEINAEFVSLTGLVFDNYTIEDNIENDSNILVCGIDFGYNHPAVCIFANVGVNYSKYHKRVNIISEIYESNLTTLDLYNRITSHRLYNPNIKFYADPSLPGNIEELRRLGLSITKANNDILYGIDVIQKSDLHIYDCPNLKRELENYTWNESTGKPNKINDDAIDAMRYAVTALVQPEVMSESIEFNKSDKKLWNRLDNKKDKPDIFW